jgi:pre-rRNA-processing protein TSR3
MRFFIVQDYKENRRKCTLTPLAGVDGMTFLCLGPRKQAPEAEVPGGVLLHIDGRPLHRSDADLLGDGCLLLVDSTWARVPKVLRRMKVTAGGRLEKRSLPRGFITAYPRKSKLKRDPDEGLASVEALFLAAVILGEPAPDLLRHYRWSAEFLRRNFEQLQAFCPGIEWPPFQSLKLPLARGDRS